jgi:hypothetical protein
LRRSTKDCAYHKNSPRQTATTLFCKPGAEEMHMDISRGHFCARIYGKMAGDQMEHPDLTPARHFSSYDKNPSVWTHCLVKKCYCNETSHKHVSVNMSDISERSLGPEIKQVGLGSTHL